MSLFAAACNHCDCAAGANSALKHLRQNLPPLNKNCVYEMCLCLAFAAVAAANLPNISECGQGEETHSVHATLWALLGRAVRKKCF